MPERMTAAEFRTTRKKKRIDRESPIQIEIVGYLRSVFPPPCIVHHCRNEISKSGRSIAVEIAKAKEKGMLPGFPDILVLPFATVGPLLFEVKAEGNYADKTQKAVHEDLRRLGYRVAVVRSVADVRESLQEWGYPACRRAGRHDRGF